MANQRDLTIDLRSDTVTKPTPAMRKAMAEAEVGDDVAGDDPTVNRLEAAAAERLGKEAGLFVPSGTMGNLIAALVHCRPGDAMIMGQFAHNRIYEAGGVAALGGIIIDPVPDLADGQPDPAGFEAAIHSDNMHHPVTRALWVENTNNRAGGAVVTPQTMTKIREIADHHGLILHVDGARIFNSAVAQGVEAAELVRDADTAMFCFSKGLCAPVGSMLVGPKDLIEQGRRKRKMLGGGMRQVGVIAAPALLALETMVERLAEDHAKAAELAEGIAATPGLELAMPAVQTNMVYFRCTDPAWPPPTLATALTEAGVWCFDVGDAVRMVCHHDVPAEHIPPAVETVCRVMDQ